MSRPAERTRRRPTRAADKRRVRAPVGSRVPGRAQPGLGLLVLALSLISPACASHTTTPASQGGSRVSFVIGAHSLAGLPISPDTSYRRVLRYFARAGQHGSSSFPDGLCRMRLAKIGLATTFITLWPGAATPAKCRFGIMAVVTGWRWHTANGLRVGATVAAMRRLFPRAYKTAKIPGKHWSIPTGSTEWWLANYASALHSTSHAARPVLAAYVRGGRVAALGIEIVGH
jgi:hypothetical protein